MKTPFDLDNINSGDIDHMFIAFEEHFLKERCLYSKVFIFSVSRSFYFFSFIFTHYYSVCLVLEKP